ncbi:MAG: GMC family oxidoreductase N-terminal domain-containing protein [Candidatus Nanopelagicales bacterium]|nr:GMC family oxidoreductase N-terminal domain-containing protein [Candidatus Nanopelagicales bacterium]
MGAFFFERMSGELHDNEGNTGHVSIDIRCDAKKAGRFLVNGQAKVTGTILAQPWAGETSCTGTVLVRPLIGRRLVYDIDFTDDEGNPCRLWGQKDVRLRHPYSSMTTMSTRLERNGVTVATGTMNFHGDDLLSFARSFSLASTALPGGTPPPKGGTPTRRTAPGRGRGMNGSDVSAHCEDWSKSDHESLLALAEAVLTEGEIVPAPDEVTVAGAQAVVDSLPPVTASLYRAGLRALDAVAVSNFGHKFAKLSLDRRRKLLDRIEGLGGTLGRTTLLALTAPLKMAHFSRPDYLQRLGIEAYAKPVDAPLPQWMAEVISPESLEPTTRIDCDVVVIGSGAGGGSSAASLAEQGLGVVIIEEGRYERRPQFSGPPQDRLLRFLREGSLNVNLTLGNTSLITPIGRMVGGTTAINSGTCFRTPDAVLGEWRASGFPSDFEPGVFGSWLDQVEAELQVAEGEPEYLGRIAEVIAKGASEMGGHHGPLRRNAPGCDAQGVCFAGCPTDAKRGSNVSWVPRALKAGARLYTGLPVTRILMTGRKVVGVLVEGQDSGGAPKSVEVHARAVIVAAGSLLTPLLLRRNGVNLPWLGRNLSIHPALGALALFAEDQDQPWRAIPQGYFVDGLADDRIRFEGFYVPPQLAAPSLMQRGEELTRWLDAWGKVGQFGFMVRDTGVGSVSIGPNGRPLIRYSLTPRVMESFRKGSAALAEMLLRGGADEVMPFINGVDSVMNVHDARALRRLRLPARKYRGMAFHPLGTARMGGSPDNAVVDFEHKVFGFDNLFVADGSCVPTSLGVNPQMTIMSMGLRAASVVGEALGS